MQIPVEGLSSPHIEKLSETLTIVFKEAYRPWQVDATPFDLVVKMAYLTNKHTSPVPHRYRNIPFLWVSLEIERHGLKGGDVTRGLWTSIEDKLLNYFLNQARTEMFPDVGVKDKFRSIGRRSHGEEAREDLPSRGESGRLP